jgi:aldose 1-epimerase
MFYQINHNKTTLEITNSKNNNFAKISLNQGASLQELKIANHTLIKDLSPLEYKNSFASSILFPFANRINDGVYTFKKQTYKFSVNELQNNNALHGLVFNKKFKVITTACTEHSASAKLLYTEDKESAGFPYTYSIELEYILNETNLDLKVKVTNTDTKEFPFTLGWHPYFVSEDLSESYLSFKSSKKLIFNDRMITIGTTTNPDASKIKLKNKQLDDCWELDETPVSFVTPNYNLSINSTEKQSFLQAYTPPVKNVIAIEPTTGISDSFNNEIGLKTLHPADTYEVKWSLKLY